MGGTTSFPGPVLAGFTNRQAAEQALSKQGQVSSHAFMS